MFQNVYCYWIDSMVVKRRLMHVVKYGFMILLVVTMGIIVISLYNSQEELAIFDKFGDDYQYFPDITLKFSAEMVDGDFEICLFEPFAFQGENMNSTLEDLYRNISRYKGVQEYTTKQKRERHPLFEVLVEFAGLMSTLNIEAVLIEPSALFCMLSPSYKDLLLKRKFDPKIYSNSEQVATFGIWEKYIPLLEKEETQAQIKNADFNIEFIREPLKDWMKVSDSQSSKELFTSHAFFKKDNFTVHLVVFYKRSTYWWHAAMKSLLYENIPPLEELHFVKEDSAFDSLIAVFPDFPDKSLINIRIPSNPQYFLFEMASSKFLDCNSSIVDSFSSNGIHTGSKDRSPLEQHRFKNRVIVALRELKVRLNPLLMNFWIWSGTLLGWYRQCGVIPYTSDVDFAAWSVEVDNLDQVLELFRKNEHLKLKQRMGTVKKGLELNLNSYKVSVDLFFVYKESNGSWYAGHRPSKGYYFKYHHPHFSLCSAELLGHKVLVPCEAEECIASEYGSNWMTPVTKWNYEKSIRNRGPNIFWKKSLLKTVYV